MMNAIRKVVIRIAYLKIAANLQKNMLKRENIWVKSTKKTEKVSRHVNYATNEMINLRRF